MSAKCENDRYDLKREKTEMAKKKNYRKNHKYIGSKRRGANMQKKLEESNEGKKIMSTRSEKEGKI